MTTLDDNIIKLIESTVRQILSDAGSSIGKKHYLLLWPDLLSDAKAAAEMLEKINEYCTITVAAGSSGHSTVYSKYTADLINTESEAGRNKLFDRLNRIDGLICVQPQLHMLKALASFDDSNFESFAVFQALMLGKQVKLAVSPAVRRARYMSAAGGPFQAQIAEVFEAVKLLGIDVDFSADNLISGQSSDDSGEAQKVSDNKRTGKGLVTEKDVIAQFSQGVRKIITDNNTIITPLAKDKARELGVDIEIR
jgi:hypothetical protein